MEETLEYIDMVIKQVCKDIVNSDGMYSMLGIVALAQLVNARATVSNPNNCKECENIEKISMELAEKLNNIAISM